jgi:predicted phage terminase large subunit-like protein
VATPEQLRQHRLDLERKYYLTEDGFLDYVRDFGAAPDATDELHGRVAKEVLNNLLRGKRKVLLLLPRGSFKSHVFNVGLSCWLIVRNPNIRILVASETFKQAVTFTRLSRQLLESAKHIEVFGRHDKQVGFSDHEFTSAQRTAQLKEPTVTATGTDQVRTGMHYDLVIGDDFVSQENTKTPEAIQSTANWVGETLAQLDPGAMWLQPGTRHHFHDQHGKILTDKAIRAQFHCIVHSYKNVDGTLLFPQRLSEEYVQAQKALLGVKLWSAFYLNAPQSDETALFRQDQFHVIGDHEIPRNCYTCILTDFASGENKRNDRTALFVVSLNPHRDAFVREVRIGRWLPDEAITQALLLYQKWQPYFVKGMTMEKTSHSEWGKASLRRLAEQFGIRPVIIEIGGRSQETKVQRIQALQPRFADGGRLYWSDKIRLFDPDLWDTMVREFCEFPFSQHDDIPDALSDLDKHREEGGFYVPSPPVGFNPARIIGARQWKPSVVDGQYNSTREVDWREMVKHHTREKDDIWSQDVGNNSPNQGSIWKRGG